MERFIYISCLDDERAIPAVMQLCDWLRFYGYVVVFAGQMQKAIEYCTAFVVIASDGYTNAIWLNGELHRAYELSRSRSNKRPLLFGLSIGDTRLPRCSEQIPVNWLGTDESFIHFLRET